MKSPAAKTRTTTMMVKTETVMATSPVCLIPVCGEERGRAVPLVTGKCDYDHTGTGGSQGVQKDDTQLLTDSRNCPQATPALRFHMIGTQLHLYRDGEAADAFADLLRLRVREIQTHVAAALVAVVGVETVSRNE